MDRLISVLAGKALDQEDIGFRAYGLIIENITNQWYYQESRRRFIPPYQAGVTIPLAGETTASLRPVTPGQIVQAAPIPNEYLTASFTDTPVAAGGGINVSGQSGPTSVPVTAVDLQQGGTPAAPTVGLSRLWADNNGLLREELSSGLVSPVGALVQERSAVGGALSPTTTSATFVDLPDLAVTLQTAGGDLSATVWGSFLHSGAANFVVLSLSLDGAAEPSAAQETVTEPAASVNFAMAVTFIFTGVAAGAHTIKGRWRTQAATATAWQAQRGLVVREVRN